MNKITIEVGTLKHAHFVDTILTTIEVAAKIRGTGIAKRDPNYVRKKFEEEKAIIAHIDNQEFVGFCYIETWGHGKFVVNSGLIVVDKYRGQGTAKAIKQAAFKLSTTRYPEAKIFGLTSGLAVMKINSDLGYVPVTFSELTDDENFWKGCESCVNHDILMRTNRKNCLCTAMIYDPAKKTPDNEKAETQVKSKKKLRKSLAVYGRWLRFKQSVLLKKYSKN